jgi:signal transduction histidine kinase
MVNRSLQLNDVLPQALSSALILLGFDAGTISVINPINGRLDTIAEHGFPSVLPTYIERGEMGQPLGQYVHTRQDVVTINDLHNEAPIDVSDLVTLGFRSYVGIPLLHGEQALGVINLFSRQHRPTSFDELALLTTIGNQVAVAVANVRLFQTIADERSRLQALIESSRDGIILISMDRRVLVTNAPALEFLRLAGQPEDWTGRPILEALAALRPHGPAAVKATVAEMHRIRQGDEPAGEGEYEVSPRTIHWSNLPVLAGTTPLGRLIVLRDVTEERSLEEMREDLTRTMVHDLRNPLTAIIGAIDLMEINGDNLLPEQRRMMAIARKRTLGMIRLIKDILDMSKFESGQIPLKRGEVSLANLIGETLQAQLPLATEKNLRLDSDISAPLPPVWIDRRLIERVLQNLVGNAIKFTPTGGSVRVTVKTVQNVANPETGPSSQLHLTVSDNGPGIPPELKSRLFQKFVTGRQEESGSGLGLAFCKLAVEAHGGQIWVDSETGQGTTFNITFPAGKKPNSHNGKQR